jgi:hypothetical protein
MVDQGALAGSGGYQRPCSATAALRSSLMTPGLDHRDHVVGVDLQDLVHPGEVQDQAAVDRVGAAGQAGPGARAITGMPRAAQAATTALHLFGAPDADRTDGVPAGAHSASS